MKMTPIGLFPQEWNVVALKNVTNVVTGATPSTEVKEYWGGHIPWMSSGELNMKFVHSVVGRITQEGYDNCGTHMIPEHCVLIGLAGQGKTRGTAAYNTIPLCTNQSIGSILPSTSFNPLYLYYWIDSQYNFLRLLSAGDGGRGGLNKQLLLNLLVPFPALSEQNKIADALFSTDSLIISLDEAIAKKRQIKEGLMQQLLTGKTRLPGFRGEWEELELGSILSYEQPGPFLVHSTDYVDSGVPVLTAGKTFILGYTNEDFGIYTNLPVIIFDDFVTESKYVDFPFKAKSSAMKMLSVRDKDRHNILFIYDVMQLIDFPMTDHKRWWIAEYSHLKVRVPASIEEEDAIANAFFTIDGEIHSLEAQREKYSLIKQGMMQVLLTGKTRL